MHTCDHCGTDCFSPENLIRVNFRDGNGDNFYGNCDALVCDECLEKFSDTYEVAESEYEDGDLAGWANPSPDDGRISQWERI